MLGIDVTIVTTPREAEAALNESEFDYLFLDGFLSLGQAGSRALYGPDVLLDWKVSNVAHPPVYVISSNAEMCERGIANGARGKLDKNMFSEFMMLNKEEHLAALAKL
jgi:hypothetical protein